MPVKLRSSTQKMVNLSMTEAELNLAGVQDILFVTNVLKSLGPKNKLPMWVRIDYGNNWSDDGRMHHV